MYLYIKLQQQPTLAESICDTRTRKIKKVFFEQINILLDWESISTTIDKYYKKGESAGGKPSYDGLLLFKMCLFKTWYGLSDYEVEYSVNDRISFSYFCGLNIDQVAPDHSTVSRFRKTMTDEGAYDNLFKLINKQLELHQIIVKKGANVDTSLIDSPLKPKEKIHTQNLMEAICYNLYRSPEIIASRLIVKIKRK